ncbi:MAG: UDP-N-acetylmuramate dehydrogenase [Clostridia bacterium]|nr:UDP-N-acetylmuramate dehydrogenase [Clostridia bacterium]
MPELERQLQEIVKKNNVLKNEPMAKHTSFKIGGIADYFIKVTNIEELKKILEFSNKNKIPITIVGNGTNILVRDGGIRGIVIKLELNGFKIKRVSAEDVLITVESGMTLAALAAIALKEEITGLEFLAGIPGSIGGAIRMNAGAYGGEMKDLVVKTRYMTYDGKIKTLELSKHEFEYRNSVFSKMDVIIIDTTIKAKKGSKLEIQEKMDEYSASRKKAQPLEYPNAGSTFKRKEGVLTAKLIDECGLKGFSVGDAEVSTKHAGFIINKGKATAKDILELVEHIKTEIKKKYDLDIELEILVLGEEK